MSNKDYNKLYSKKDPKLEIEDLQTVISKRLKDPEMAKKAAMIIESMIHGLDKIKDKDAA